MVLWVCCGAAASRAMDKPALRERLTPGAPRFPAVDWDCPIQHYPSGGDAVAASSCDLVARL